MKYWKQGFYETPIEGAIEITNERFEELIDGQNAGKMITEDEQGRPVLTECVETSPVMTYEERVQTLIREQYSIADELAILRQRDTKPDEFAASSNTRSNARRRQKSRCNYDWKNTTPEIYGSGAQSGQSLTTRWRGRLRIRHGSS